MHLDVKDLLSGKTHRIEEKGGVIGRAGADIVIDDAKVAEKHARIYFDKGHWYIEDLKTELGVTVHTVKLAAPAELRFGSRFAIGEHRFEVMIPVGTGTAKVQAPIAKAAPAAAPAAAAAPAPDAQATQVTVQVRPAVAAPVSAPAAAPSTSGLTPVTVTAPVPLAPTPSAAVAAAIAEIAEPEPDAEPAEAAAEPTRLLPQPPPPRDEPTFSQTLHGADRWQVIAGLASGAFILACIAWAIVSAPGAPPPKPVVTEAKNAPEPASAPAAEQPPPEPVPAKLDKPIDPYQAFVKKRDEIDRLIGVNPLLLKQVDGVLPLYDKLHSELVKIEAQAKKKPKKHAKLVDDRLREAETFERTQGLVDSLYDKLAKAGVIAAQ